MIDSIYVTSGWQARDERWISALIQLGRTPHIVSLGRDANTIPELKIAVMLAASGHESSIPVLAGPLADIAKPLTELNVNLIGLAGYRELKELETAGANLAWLSELAHLVVGSDAEGEIAVQAGLSSDLIDTLSWGVDLENFVFHGPWIDAFILGVPPHAPLVLSLKPHEPIHRIQEIIEAFALLERDPNLHEDFPDPYLIIGNSGSLTDDLKLTARKGGVSDRVRWIGRPTDAELARILARGCAYVTASDFDQDSDSMLQAMACGTPVIASDSRGNLAWIDDRVSGFTFATGDVRDLAMVLQEVTNAYPLDIVNYARGVVERKADRRDGLSTLKQILERS